MQFFGQFSIYSYTVIKFLNIKAYMQTSLSINQQSFLIHSLPHFLLSLSLYLYLKIFLAPFWIAIAEHLLDPLRAMRLPQGSKFNKTVAKVYAETFIYSTMLCPSTNYMTMNKVHIELTLNSTKTSQIFWIN